MIFVDTSVWSLAFRRKQEQAGVPVVNQLRALIEQDEPLAVPGIVLQELLTGLKEESQFNRMYKLITAFTIVMADESHHKLAAQTANTCRKKRRCHDSNRLFDCGDGDRLQRSIADNR